jgi:hypothetical protein
MGGGSSALPSQRTHAVSATATVFTVGVRAGSASDFCFAEGALYKFSLG